MAQPVTFELEAPRAVANWRPLVHWLLALPHVLIAGALGQVAGLIAFVSWFIILFTGRLPTGIADFQCMVLRYTARTYSYVLWLRESYPPFTFDLVADDPGDDPLRVDVVAQLEGRDRVTVGLRFIWIIPAGLFLAVMVIAAYAVAFVGFFAVLFTGRWPEGLRSFLVGVGRLSARVAAYSYLLVDTYPPFSTDD